MQVENSGGARIVTAGLDSVALQALGRPWV
jgi:hypothetical protein